MERIAISIVFNGIKHLNNQFKWDGKEGRYKGLHEHFDHWIFVEGASKSTFCTSWCKEMPEEFHSNGHSVDSTFGFLHDLENLYPHKITVIEQDGLWDGKVNMFNAALDLLDRNPRDCFLWEIDIDEYWEPHQLANAEKILTDHNLDIGSFSCDYLLSDQIIVRGDWGESIRHGYRRLWRYKTGSRFIAHEPPVLSNTSRMAPPHLMPRFKHLSYYYEEDVIFKSKWYGNHHNIYNGWRDILSGATKLPCRVEDLFKAEIPTDWRNTVITYR
jgi:hypothetical protein